MGRRHISPAALQAGRRQQRHFAGCPPPRRAGQARGLDRDGFKAISNRWTAALASAARRRAGGEVALLAATGLQGGWADVPPAHVEAIVAAFMACGRVTEARLLAAEAITRSA